MIDNSQETEDVLLGRDRFLSELQGVISKDIPDNIELVGARGFGKTIVLNHLQRWVEESDSSAYKLVVRWNLTEPPVKSDEEFLEQLSEKIREALLSKKQTDYAGVFGDSSFTTLYDGLQLLDDEGFPILFLWDGIDKPLQRDRLTVDLWDNLNALFKLEKHSLVIATQRPLSQQIQDEVAASEFWGILCKHELQPFGDTQCKEIVEYYGFKEIGPGAIKELLNKTGGIPQLTMMVVDFLNRSGAQEFVQKDVKSLSSDQELEAEIEGHLSLIRRGLKRVGREYKNIRHAKRRGINANELDRDIKTELLRAGVILETQGKLFSTADLVIKYMDSFNDEEAEKIDVSGESYLASMQIILERRLKMLDHPVYPYAVKKLEKSIPELTDEPFECWGHLDGIVKGVVKKILDLEFPGGEIDKEIASYWEECDDFSSGAYKPLPKWFRKQLEAKDYSIPTDDTMQFKIVRWLTGCSPHIKEKKSKQCSKQTCYMLEALRSFRNFHAHSGGEQISGETALSGVLLCLEMLNSLQNDWDNAES